MTVAEKAHQNNFGAARLILACAVIISHSPQMLDGNSLREPLTALGSSQTFGGLAVDGFFIISGYLIASSYLSNRSLAKFLTSRILRIYPAFLVAYLICFFLIGPMAGGTFDALSAREWLSVFGRMLSLASPTLPNAFHTLPIPALDGSMWTIRYEFRCYLLVGLLGVAGILDRGKLILLLTAIFYLMAIYIFMTGGISIPRGHLHQLVFVLIGDPASAFALTAIFMSGVCARLYRTKIRFRPVLLALSAIILTAAIMRLSFPEVVIGTVGMYLLLWTALGLKSRFLSRINNSYDFSYGTYLYAWPIGSLIILGAQYHHIFLSPTVLTALTVVFAILIGAASWYAIEKPVLSLKPRRPKAIQTATARS